MCEQQIKVKTVVQFVTILTILFQHKKNNRNEAPVKKFLQVHKTLTLAAAIKKNKKEVKANTKVILYKSILNLLQTLITLTNQAKYCINNITML